MLEKAVQEFIMIVLSAVVTVFLPVLVAFAVSWLRAQKELVLSRLTVEQRDLLFSIVAALVQAAEQAGIVGIIEDTGEAKKRWVIERVQTWLDTHNLPAVDAEEIADLIEAAINQGVHQFGAAVVTASAAEEE